MPECECNECHQSARLHSELDHAGMLREVGRQNRGEMQTNLLFDPGFLRHGRGDWATRQQGHWLRCGNQVVVLMKDDFPSSEEEFPQQEGPLIQPPRGSSWRPLPTSNRVTDTFAFPFRWIAKVRILRNGRYDSGGTGVLISDRHVLTAAHVVEDVVRDPIQFGVEVTMALDVTRNLGVSLSAKKPDIAPGLVAGTDYALITLKDRLGDTKPRGLRGDKLGYWGTSAGGTVTTAVPVDPGRLVTQMAYTTGYPAKRSGNQMWTFSGLLVSAPQQSQIMSFTGEATKGQSGSPVWIRENGNDNMVGILVARGDVGFVVRLTWDVVFQVNNWMLASSKGTQELEFEGDQMKSRAGLYGHRFLPAGSIGLPRSDGAARYDAELGGGADDKARIRQAVQGGTRDENQLTDMVFNIRHPERQRQRLKSNERQLIQEWIEIRDLLVRPALGLSAAPSNPGWVRTLLPLLDRYRGKIPLDFLLGWVQVESGGNIRSLTPWNERGYFQLYPDDSVGLKLNHERLSSDPDYSVQAGIALVNRDAAWAQGLGFKSGSDLLWHVVKLRHWLPAGINAIVRDMRQHHVVPDTWDDFEEYVAANRPRINESIRIAAGLKQPLPPKWDVAYGIAFVNRMFNEGRRLAAGLTNP